MDPKVGMRYEDVAKRVKRIHKNTPNSPAKKNLINSLLGQADKCEGSQAVREIIKETNCVSPTGAIRTGWSPAYEQAYDRIFKKGK